MRLLKESVLQIWKARKAAVQGEVAIAERAARAIREKLDQLTLARIDRHSGQLEELDMEGILAFAERVLPRAADLWVQASLDQRQRFQQLFFPDGIAFDGNRFIGTGATAPGFSYCGKSEPEMKIGSPAVARSAAGRPTVAPPALWWATSA
jgi:hypothetical protein